MVNTIDSFMVFQSYDDTYAVTDMPQTDSIPNIFSASGSGPAVWSPSNLFPITTWSMDIEQTLNIGSQSSGAGAGKVMFNPFSITRRTDSLSTALFAMTCSGTPFHRVYLIERRTSSDNPSVHPVFGGWLFGLCALKSIEWARQLNTPAENVSFEYGQLIEGYQTRQANGTAGPVLVRGWDVVKNVATTTVP